MSGLLFLKISLVPSLIVAITIAGRRWGAAVAGCLAAFPVVAGPILFFVAIEQGADFAAEAAAAAIAGVLGNIGFGLIYSWVSRRKPWHVSMLAGWIGYFCVAVIFNLLSLSALPAAAVTMAGLFIAARLYPSTPVEVSSTSRPASDLKCRVIAGLALVLAVTIFSAELGATWSGLFSVFPVMGSVLAVFSHRSVGQDFAVRLLHGMVKGFFAFTLFCLVLAYALHSGSVAFAFLVALVAAVVVQALLMKYKK